MSGASGELFIRGLAALRRATIWWAVGIAAFVVVNTAFWPSLEHSDALTSLEKSAGPLLQAFGAQNIASPAGYLDGQLYALLLPLLLTAMAVATTSTLTSGDEDAGRLELLHALPVSRQSIWLARFAAAMASMLAVSAVAAVVVIASVPVFSLNGVGTVRILAATVACAVLATFHAAVAYLVGALGRPRPVAIGITVGIAVAGYVASYLFPLSRPLTGFRRISPWYWALGDQPVAHGIHPIEVLLVLVVAASLVAVGTRQLQRRDIRSA